MNDWRRHVPYNVRLFLAGLLLAVGWLAVQYCEFSYDFGVAKLGAEAALKEQDKKK